ncbi:RNA polymerase sigma-70 factor (ECF subfamily) [Prauserella shujinwangii]|uniref:RNA polymerase sigma-70 factor (ECF subfamily) n=1 Tax=Prauserella shujinwangii TaxID=1453103 RepID=A0A2T0LZ15_9PSEU|nr:RNA polymerase sigma factor ShbA [Prauserella shujinwangii]PRX49358.1 RNA polymerase sigma-70 factor (ECF subfamily) [Prauserella shujinwangii]
MESAAAATVETAPEPGNGHDDQLNALAARAATGDRAAAERLLTVVRPAIVRYCRARIGRSFGTYSSADDVAQEACLGIYRSLSGYRSIGNSFRAFAYRIAANKVVDHYRKSKVGREMSYEVLPEEVDTSANPESLFLKSEYAGQMRRLLGHVSERDRDILVLRCVVGLSAEETAQTIGSTPGAVRVAQHRALTKLRAVLSVHPDGPA